MDGNDWCGVILCLCVLVFVLAFSGVVYTNRLREDTLRGECVARGRTWYSGNCAPVGFTLPLR